MFFLKQSLMPQKNLKKLAIMYENSINIYISLLAKFVGFQQKNTDIGRPQGVCIFFGSFLGKA